MSALYDMVIGLSVINRAGNSFNLMSLRKGKNMYPRFLFLTFKISKFFSNFVMLTLGLTGTAKHIVLPRAQSYTVFLL